MGRAARVPVTLGWAARTHTGCVRATNQDSLLAASPLFVVADGMGGHAAGNVASELTIDEFRGLAGRWDLSIRDIVAAAARANEALLAHVDEHPEHDGMGTTITGFAVVNGRTGPHAAVLNVGDSRTYLLRGRTLQQLTTDHSVVQELLDSGAITAAEAAEHPHRHVITRALGIDTDVDIQSIAVPLHEGDRLLVCSDGLSSLIEDEALQAMLCAGADATHTVDELLQRCLDLNAPDNVSAIVVDVLAIGDRSADTLADDDTLPGLPITTKA